MPSSADSSSTKLLEATGLHKCFGDLVAVDGIDVSISPGECFGLLGPNGAGKSTTMRMCLGLSPPDAGEIRLIDLPLPDKILEARQQVGVVPQDDWLDPDFTVEENLRMYGRYFGIERTVLQQRINSLLSFAELDQRATERITNLSGGLRRRLTLARALINEPRLVFLDEPTTGLDPQARHLYWERLRSLLDDNRALFLTTHFMDEAMRLCDRVSIVDHGKIIATGSPTELVAQHVEAEVAEIHGDGSAGWTQANATDCRVEILGRAAYCYGHDVGAVTTAAATTGTLSCTRRPTNLEDVYLRLTGHSLRD